MVRISGGLARRPELTQDGFTLIVCHELGHHLGGFAFSPPDPLIGVWAATEGQSDYFATQVCARKLWAQDFSINAEFRKTAKPIVLSLCNQVWSGANDQDLCYRVLTASESVITTMAALMGKPVPQMDTPDTSVVSQTESKHPAIQCRLDTSVQGALCLARHDERVIPGRKIPSGEFSLEAEQAAVANSCMASSGYSQGLRPKCWFKPRL